MGSIPAVKAWPLFSLLIFLGSGGSLSYAQTNTFPSDGNVGIGTTSPLSNLSIGGAGTADADLFIGNNAQDAAIYIDGAANGVGSKIILQGRDSVVRTTVLKHDAAGLFTIDNSGTAGTEFAITNGNIGIGTTSPLSKLSIGGAGTADADLFIGNNAQDAAIYIDGAANGVGSKIILQGRDSVVRTTVLKHDAAGLFTIDNSGTAGTEFAITGGNVGIGTTSPSEKLHVAGNAKIGGDLTADGNIAAKYQDVAEWVRAGSALQPGTVVVINSAKDDQVLPASRPYDTRVAGVVSAQPGIILGEAGADKSKVAHSGRVRVKVDAQYGSVAVGDLLVSSPTAGYAMLSRPIELSGISIHRPGTIVGKALEPLKEGQGEILVLLTLQ